MPTTFLFCKNELFKSYIIDLIDWLEVINLSKVHNSFIYQNIP